MTTPDPNQPERIDPRLQRLTDYALGRFDDAAGAEERAAIEAELSGDAEARRYVAETRELAGAVADALHSQAGPSLTNQQQDAIEKEVAAMTQRTQATGRSWFLPFAAAVAAGVIGAVSASLITANVLHDAGGGSGGPPGTGSQHVGNSPATPSPEAVKSDRNATPAQVDPRLNDPELRKLDKPIDVAFAATPLRDALEVIRQATGANMVVRWPTLEAVGVEGDAPVTLKLEGVPARHALAHVLDHASGGNELEPIGFDGWGGTITVSTQRDLKSNAVVLTYDVRDLLAAATPPGSTGLTGMFGAPEFDLNSALSNTNSGSGGATLFSAESSTPSRPRLTGGHARPGDVRIATRPTSREVVYQQAQGVAQASTSLFGEVDGNADYLLEERMDDLASLIQDTAGDPSDWQAYGGQFANLRQMDHQLIVRASPQQHREIQDLLDQLRQGRPGQPAQQPQAAQEPDAAELNEVAAAMRARAEELARLQQELDQASRLAAETYELIVDNPFRLVDDEPLSTFSVDVDTAAYANTRRYLNDGALPPPDAVRIEELINYFRYDYAPPAADGEDPFAAHIEVNRCPWEPDHRLVRIGLKGKEIDAGERAPANLVFLIDVSGSMASDDKLPLLKQGLELMVNELADKDRVAVVVYASAEGLALPSTPATNRGAILDAIHQLGAGGSTAGEAGIQLAYKTAEQHFIKGGVNRVILATDGDFNVGVSDTAELVRLIEQKRQTGVFLSVLGFGTGNLKDERMQKLAHHGNGNYNYIDSIREARKVLVEQMGGTIVPIAKDVKLQLEFNPSKVKSFRLIGYENRVLAHQDFNDDLKDAGEIGAGHTVTALYEIVLHVPADDAGAGAEAGQIEKIDELKYQRPRELADAARSNELLTLKLRYKQPDGDESKLLSFAVDDVADPDLAQSSADYRFAAAVASFGMLLRDSPHKGDANWESVHELAAKSLPDVKAEREREYRQEFVTLVEKAKQLSEPRP